MPLASFLESYREGLILAVGNSYPPVVSQGGPLPPLLRPPLGRQHEAITATAASLLAHRNTLVVAEMGTGKSMIAIASAATAGMKRVLVMAPPHLVEKWAREVKATIPGAKTRILESIGDVDALKDYRRSAPLGAGSSDPTLDEAPLFVMLSREKAKLGHAWKPAYVLKKRFYKGSGTFELPTCPNCGQVLETDEGLLTHEALAKKKHTCSCGSPLWQADRSGPRRYPLETQGLL
jgi:hypothetical protein